MNISGKVVGRFVTSSSVFFKCLHDDPIQIAAKLSLQPGEILFVDDLQTNIERAQAAGWQTILYVDKTGFLESIDEMLGANHP